MHHPDRLIETSRIVVRFGIVVNRLFLGAVCLGLLLSWLLADVFAAFLVGSRPGVDAASELIGLRFEMLIGVVMAVATDRLLVALKAMVDSARNADPFNRINAGRLRTIGWSLLVLQLLGIAGFILGRAVPSLGSAAPDAEFSPGGWVAVLMVFILSRVFSTGAAMRDDLAGTI